MMEKIRKKNKLFRRGLYGSLLLAAIIVPTTFASHIVDAVGYVSSPPSRAYYGHTLAPDEGSDIWASVHKIYGNAMGDYHNMSSSKTFDQLPDGNIASADNAHPDNSLGEPVYSLIDKQTSDAWVKQSMKYGMNAITWTNPVEQATKSWQYFITKPDWDPDKPLAKDEFMPLKDENGKTVINGKDQLSGKTVTHNLNIPKEVKPGYNVIVAVWNLSRQQLSYYQVIDIDLPEPLGVPSNLKVTDISETAATLSWDAPKNESASDLMYNVYKEGEEKPIAKVKGTSYQLTGLKPDTTTKYNVTALKENGEESEHSEWVSVKTFKHLDAPTNLKVKDISWTTATLTWDAVPSEGNLVYKIYKEGQTTPYRAVTGTSCNLVGLKPDTTTKFSVTAATADGRESEHSKWVTVKTLKDTEPPEVPVLKVDNVGTTTIDISWDKVKDNVGVSYMVIYKDNKAFATLDPETTNYQFKQLYLETNYTIKLIAYDESGNSSTSEEINVKTLPDTEPPSPVTNFKAEKIGSRSVQLKWDEAKDNVKVASYTLYRDGKKIAENIKETEWVDNDLMPYTIYKYEIEAVDTSGNVSRKKRLIVRTNQVSVKAQIQLKFSAPNNFFRFRPKDTNLVLLTAPPAGNHTPLAIFFAVPKGYYWGEDTYINNVKGGIVPELVNEILDNHQQLFIQGGIINVYPSGSVGILESGIHPLATVQGVENGVATIKATGTFSNDYGSVTFDITISIDVY